MTILQKFESKYFKLSFINSILFIAFVIMVLVSVFILSIVVFFELVAVIIDKSSLSHWINIFSVSVALVILFLVTCYLSLITFHYLIDSKNNFLRIFIALIVIVTSFFSFGILLNPALMDVSNSKQIITVNQATFIMDSYPDKTQLKNLKQNNFTAVISLLHPSVFPFEGNLLRKELDNAKQLNTIVIQINDILPWSTSNKIRTKKIIDTLINTKGKYYVHSYLGNVRLSVFTNLLLDQKNNLDVKPFQVNTPLEKTKTFERGEIIELADDIYFTPYPTDSEFVNIVIPNGVKSVVSLLNDKNPADTSWITKERKLLREKSIPFFLKPITIYPYDAGGVFETTLFVRGLPKPVIVHALNTNSLISEAFIMNFKNEKKSFPPSLFLGKMENGIATVILPNVVAGPKPTINEYKNFIVEKGIRGLIYCGPQNKILKKSDAQFFRKLGLTWEKINLDSLSHKNEIKLGGMWYIYGADSLEIKKRLLK